MPRPGPAKPEPRDGAPPLGRPAPGPPGRGPDVVGRLGPPVPTGPRPRAEAGMRPVRALVPLVGRLGGRLVMGRNTPPSPGRRAAPGGGGITRPPGGGGIVRPVGKLAAGFIGAAVAAGAIFGVATTGTGGTAVTDVAVVVGVTFAGATGAGCAWRTVVGAAERIGCTEETIGASLCFSTIGSGTTSATRATSSSLVVFLGATDLGPVACFAGAFLAAAFFTGVAPSAAFFGAAFFATLASDGCSSRTNPSRLARTRTRSACCSIIVDDCVLTPMPNLEHRSSVS